MTTSKPTAGHSSWARVTVGAAGHVRLGASRSPARMQSSTPVPYLRAANVGQGELRLDDVLEMEFSADERVRYELQVGDIVLAEASGSADQVGRSAMWAGEIDNCCYQNTVIRFRPWLLVPQFAGLLFRQLQASGTFADAARGSGILHLTASRFAKIEFALPPLSDQIAISTEANRRFQQIASARNALHSALEKNARRVTETLNLAASGQLTSGDQSNWKYKRVDEVGEVLLGPRRTPERASGNFMRPYLRVANVQEARIDVADVHEMSFDEAEFQLYQLRAGDILLNEGQSPDLVGRPAMFNNEIPDVCFQNTLLRFRAGSEMLPEFALIVFRNHLRQGRFRDIAKWSTSIAHLTRKRFVEMQVPVPSVDEQASIVAEVRMLLEAAESDDQSIRLALNRLDDLERETLELSTSGQLIALSPTDESAHELIERMGPPIELIRDTDVSTEPERTTSMPAEDSAKSTDTATGGRLQHLVTEAGRPVGMPELFRMAGYDRDSVADVEEFYLELRSELAGRFLSEVGPEAENVSLVAVNSETA